LYNGQKLRNRPHKGYLKPKGHEGHELRKILIPYPEGYEHQKVTTLPESPLESWNNHQKEVVEKKFYVHLIQRLTSFKSIIPKFWRDRKPKF
jgi:hypothetical protein